MAQRSVPRPIVKNRVIAATSTLLGVALLIAGCGGKPEHKAAPTPSPTAGSASPTPSRVVPTPSTSPTIKPPRTPEKKLALMRTTGSAAVALTFDDGPHPVWTPKVLDSLKARGIKATFCVIGRHAAAYPQLIARMVREGHTMCNHSWNHEFKLGSWTEAQIRVNMQLTNNAIQKAVPGVPIPYFRHPGGRWTSAAVRVAKQLGMRSMDWAVDPWDWDRPGTNAIINRVLRNTRAGSIVLLHDGGGDRNQTLAALPHIISSLRSKYRLIAMPLPH